MIGRVIRRIRYELFPSDQQLMAKKWKADGGDYELRFNYDLTPTSKVLDLGGYEGQWASDIYSRYCCQIYIFEPVKAFADRIESRYSHNSDIHVMQYGLGASSRSEALSVAQDGSSAFKDFGNSEEIEILDVVTWLEDNKIDEIDLMKVNIEGGEYELLERLIETQRIRSIRNLQVQFHELTKDSESRMKRIQTRLRETHRPTYQYKFIWENWEREDP